MPRKGSSSRSVRGGLCLGGLHGAGDERELVRGCAGLQSPSFPGPELPMGDGVLHPSDRAVGTAARGLAASSGGLQLVVWTVRGL